MATRIARISLTDSQLQNEHRNDLFKNFRTAFDEAFGHVIMPPAGRLLSPPPLYVSKRIWLAHGHVQPPGPFPYEDLLDEVFWNADLHRPMVFLVGDVGCGKSTLISYYLQHHCPKGHEQEYGKKLIININLRNVDTPAQFDATFFDEVKRAIIAEFTRKVGKDIEADGCYAMWDAHFRWDSQLHRDAMGDKEPAHYRADLVGKLLASNLSDEKWVRYALEYISRLAMGPQTDRSPFSFIVLCLDNLDQSDFAVQKHAIALSRQWSDPASPIKLWQVYMPLRPGIFDDIIRKVEPLPAHHVIRLSKPDAVEVLRVRSELAQGQIGRDGRSIIISEDDDTQKADNVICKQCIRDAFQMAREQFLDMLDGFAAGSLRRQLALWQSTLSSRSFQASCLRSRIMNLGPFHIEDIGTYALADALITGQHLFHHRDNNVVANLFYACPAPSDCREALVGLHLFHVVRRKNSTVAEIMLNLKGIGYSDDQVIQAIEYFEAKEILKRYSNDGVESIEKNHQVIGAHDKMMGEAAYLDNMAMVTPLESSRLSKIVITRSHRNDQFVNRVHSTFSLLEQLQQDEDEFMRSTKGSSDLTIDEFKRNVRSLQVPRYFKKMAIAYKGRLEGLRSRGFPSNVTSREHDRLVNHSIFSIAASLSDLLE